MKIQIEAGSGRDVQTRHHWQGDGPWIWNGQNPGQAGQTYCQAVNTGPILQENVKSWINGLCSRGCWMDGVWSDNFRTVFRIKFNWKIAILGRIENLKSGGKCEWGNDGKLSASGNLVYRDSRGIEGKWFFFAIKSTFLIPSICNFDRLISMMRQFQNSLQN